MTLQSARSDRNKMDAEVTRLTEELAGLDREWDRVAYYGVSAALALPALYFWGVLGMLLTLLASGSLVATAAYLLYVRRKETRGDLDMLREDMRREDALSRSASP